MSILESAVTIVGVAMALSGVPQIIKIFQRKSAKDISPTTYITVILGTVIWILYSLQIKNTPLLLSNSIGIIANTTILLGWYLYGRDK